MNENMLPQDKGVRQSHCAKSLWQRAKRSSSLCHAPADMINYANSFRQTQLVT